MKLTLVELQSKLKKTRSRALYRGFLIIVELNLKKQGTRNQNYDNESQNKRLIVCIVSYGIVLL